MKKLLLLFALLATTLSSNADVAINSTNFPDTRFREYLTNYMPGGSDGVFTDAEIAAITEIDMNGWQQIMHNVEGVQYFTNLRKLRLADNANVTKIPLRGLTHLTYLECVKYGDGIDMTEDPDLYDCTELDTLILRGHHMTTLDLSRQTKLKYLNVMSCNLTALDLSHNPLLEYLDMSYDELTSRSLDASMFPNLKELNCGYCKLTALNVTGCTKLEKLFCQWNAFDMTQLDLSTNTALVEMNCESSYGSGVLNLSNQPNLTTLTARNCDLTGLICANVGNLVYLDVANNNALDMLELQGATKLDELNCANCGITSLVVPENVRELNVSYCPNLTTLIVGSNDKIKHIFFSNTPALTTLDISNCPNLIQLSGAYTGLPEVDFSGCPKLQNFEAGMDLNLKRVDFSQNPNMWGINLSSCSNVEELILPPAIISHQPNTQLKRIYIGATQHIKHLDLTNYNGIERFDAAYSALEDVKFGAGLNTIDELNLTYSAVSQLDLSGVQRFYNAPTLDAHVYAPVYSYNGKLYLKIHPYCDYFDPSRVSELKVNNVERPVVMNGMNLLEVGNEGDYITRVTYKYDTRCNAVLGFPGSNEEPLTDVYLTYTYETYNEVERVRWLIPIDEDHFPDDQFRTAVSTKYSDDYQFLKQQVAESYHKMDLEGRAGYQGIQSLEGIQYYCNLDTLWCPANQISDFDMTALPDLTFLNCSQNYVNPNYSPMAVATLLESLPDNNTEKTLYYRGANLENNVQLTYAQCQYLKSKHWTPMVNEYVNGAYEWREYTGTVVSDSIIVKTTMVSNANQNDVLGDGKVSYDPIRNILTLNGVNLSQSSLTNLVCSREGLVIKLIGTNNIRERATFNKNTTIIGPGTLNVSMLTRTNQVMINNGACLHIGDSAQVNITASSSGYSGGTGIYGSAGSTLKVDGSNTQLTIDAKKYAVSGLGNLELGEGYRLETPAHGTLDDRDGMVYSPRRVPATNVVIKYAPIFGDADGDTYITATDIETMANIIVGKAPRTVGDDVNHDGEVSVSDLTALVDIVKSPYGTVIKPITSITLPQSKLMMEGDRESLYVSSYLPTDADHAEFIWCSSDSTVARVYKVSYNYYITAVAPGTCVVTCEADDGSGVTATMQVRVSAPSFIDLGLPSGTQWATQNVGATAPEEIGSYFAWGDTTPRTTGYTWNGYFDTNDGGTTFNVFYNNGGLTSLIPTLDAAYQINGSDYQIPDTLQWQELLDYCTLSCDTINNNKGGLTFTSTINGKSIYLPFTGIYGLASGSGRSLPKRGFYWSRDLDPHNDKYAYFVQLVSTPQASLGTAYERYFGMPIRPVKRQ